MMLVPFISQIAGVPSLPCQRMSALPSPLKSPVPTTLQPGPGVVRAPAPTMLVPFISQIADVPSQRAGHCVLLSSVCKHWSLILRW